MSSLGTQGSDSQSQFLNSLINQQSYQQQRAQKHEAQDVRGNQQSNRAHAKQRLANQRFGRSPRETLSQAVRGEHPVLKGDKELLKPRLPHANLPKNPTLGSGKGVSLIAIVAEVMILQAKCNSNFWQTLWHEASQNMMMNIKMAPVIAKATENAADAQASATENEGKMSRIMGIVDIVGFTAAIGLGTWSAAAEPENVASDATGGEAADAEGSALLKNDDIGEEQTLKRMETQGPRTEAQTAVEEASSRIGPKTEEEAALEKATKGYQDSEIERIYGGKTKRSAKRMLQKLKKAFSHSSPALKALTSAAQHAMLVQMLTGGSNALTQYTYKSKIAAFQKLAGKWQAVEKMGDIQVQFYQQAFGRTDSVMQGSQSNVDQAMQILQQTSDRITSTVSSGFQGAV